MKIATEDRKTEDLVVDAIVHETRADNRQDAGAVPSNEGT
ncbi:hypothetical protein ACZ87_03001 [Candidatus Erwinia dacicola]|uniref:Uncharacterized protein n=1 Tax=Candidatus Erwinia dacicola TaxID=252393 RepID=A0A328TR06_9GAMM|nr:hypothetical protein ACZ87_03001 [Candidatus Erwinia dacicola]